MYSDRVKARKTVLWGTPCDACAIANCTFDGENLSALLDGGYDNLVWLPDFSLFMKDKEILQSKTQWLNDAIINAVTQCFARTLVKSED